MRQRRAETLMQFFKKPSGDPLIVTMAGVKLGNRLLVVGCSDVPLIAAGATKAGLTGRACAVDADGARTASAAAAVEREGALVETFTAPWSALPFEAESFDVVVIRSVLGHLDATTRARAAQEAARVLRGGGRCLVIDDEPRGGLGGLMHRAEQASDYQSTGGAAPVLEGAGLRGVRTLAARERLVFVEGIKPAPSA